MAFDIKRIDPIDLQPTRAVGVALPFSDKAVFKSTYTTKDAIKNNIINYFLTNKGERFLNPTFGSDIRSQLFNNINSENLENLKEIIGNEMSNYFPRVAVKQLRISPEPDNNYISVYLKYQVTDTNIEDELIINVEQ